MNTSPQERITINTEVCGGQPCIRGMRIRVVDILDLLASGLTQQQIIEELPDLELADIESALMCASISMKNIDRKRALLSVSVWSDEDLKIFEENKKLFNWEPPEW